MNVTESRIDLCQVSVFCAEKKGREMVDPEVSVCCV